MNRDTVKKMKKMKMVKWYFWSCYEVAGKKYRGAGRSRLKDNTFSFQVDL